MVSTLRIFGPEVGESQAYVVADVTGVTPSGDIELTTSGGTTFSMGTDRLRSLYEDRLAHDEANINSGDAIWKALDDVETHYAQTDGSNDAFIEAARVLFRGAR